MQYTKMFSYLFLNSLIFRCFFYFIQVINTCGSPGSLSHGFMTSSLPNYVIGTVVSFICHSGYKLIGDVTTRTCMRDGHWTGFKNPKCIGQYLVLTPSKLIALPDKNYGSTINLFLLYSIIALFCEEPGRILYGRHDNLHLENKYSYGSQVTYSCTSRYYLWGNATVTCQADNSGLTYWSGPIPSCLTLSGFDEECVRQKGKFKVDLGRPICLFPGKLYYLCVLWG